MVGTVETELRQKTFSTHRKRNTMLSRHSIDTELWQKRCRLSTYNWKLLISEQNSFSKLSTNYNFKITKHSKGIAHIERKIVGLVGTNKKYKTYGQLCFVGLVNFNKHNIVTVKTEETKHTKKL